MQVIPGPTGKETVDKIASTLEITEIIPTYKEFNDGETYIRITEELDDQIIIVQSCHPPQEANLFALLNLISTIKHQNQSHIFAYIPYLCYARADREVLGGEAISIRTVLELLEAVQVDHLFTLDIHNPEVFNYTNAMKTTNFFPSKSWKKYLKHHNVPIDKLQVIAPDQGAINRAKSLANELEVPYTNLSKTRDPTSGEIELSVDQSEISGEELVVVDDIMSTGSTLIEVALKIKSMHDVEKIHFLISHALGTDAVERLKKVGKGIVAATNSVPSSIGKISHVPDFLEVISNEMDH